MVTGRAVVTGDEAAAAYEAGGDPETIVRELVASGWTLNGAADFLMFVRYSGGVDPVDRFPHLKTTSS